MYIKIVAKANKGKQAAGVEKGRAHSMKREAAEKSSSSRRRGIKSEYNSWYVGGLIVS